MVWLTKAVLRNVVGKPIRKYLKGNFVDSLRLRVRGGAGGMGYPKFGGVGGKGGSVYVVATEGVDLKHVLRKFPQKHVKAENGENSRPKCILGQPGKDVHVEVPVGIIIIDEHGRKIGELNETGSTCLVAEGSPGGCEQTGFNGAPAVEKSVALDLRLIADVGLVGFPNAGKSSLLRGISRAKPKVASYPFTTLKPTLGLVQLPDLRQYTVADLPGLIEGAHVNIGLGHRFLKHIERTRVLLLVVDVFGFSLSPKYASRSCLDTIVLLNKELELYREDLMEKPAGLVINKLDLPDAKEKFEEIKQDLKKLPEIVETMPEEFRPNKLLNFQFVMGLSAKLGPKEDFDKLKHYLRDTMEWVYVEGFGDIPHTSVDESGHVVWNSEPARTLKKPEDILKNISERGKQLV
ncbi:GTP-binding protein 10 homolog [Ischnura elegans]|uniref:GTP-binding protein 10 homolog n=1 Tax=Ischnura elegans TaxID=197161 RepID=UPI001ED886BC|nr:GTP-binding protein 10 homolog [Ischnura elegans]